MSMIKEFKDFAVKGNAVDLAIGVAVGAAFGAITNSIVNDIINPIAGFIMGGRDFSKYGITLREATENSEAVIIGYGALINNFINFLIIAFVLFLVVKSINRLRDQMEKDKKDEKESTPEPPADIKLLTEIRDLLRKQS